jgi:hypothetical protein
MLEPDEYGDHADTVLAVLYREWPWLRAEAEDASAAVVPAADRAALKTRIAAAVQPLLMDALPKPIAAVRADEVADAVLSVLPAPADRAAVLAEVLAALDAGLSDFFQQWPDEPKNSPWVLGWKDATEAVRRLAAVPAVGVAADTTLGDPEPESGCAHCGGPHDWADCEAYTALAAAEPGPVVPAQPGNDTKTRCTCADAGDCFAPAGHYTDCPRAETPQPKEA